MQLSTQEKQKKTRASGYDLEFKFYLHWPPIQLGKFRVLYLQNGNYNPTAWNLYKDPVKALNPGGQHIASCRALEKLIPFSSLLHYLSVKEIQEKMRLISSFLLLQERGFTG